MRRQFSAPALLLVAFLLLLGAWVGANAPGNGPDEPANYIKAIGAGTGHGSGREAHLPDAVFGTDPTAAYRVDWINENSRGFRMPAGLTPERFTCFYEAFTIDEPATCSVRTPQGKSNVEWISYVGTYPPFVFAIPGLVMARASSALTAMYLGRAVLGLLTAALLAIAVRSAWSPRVGAVSLAGTALAVSPMVLFLGTSLGANGVEVAGALSLFAVVLRGARDDPPRWLWPAGFAAAASTVLARPTGLLWLALAVGLAFVLHGVRPALAATRQGRGRWWAIATALAAVPAVVWDRLVQPHPALDWELVGDSIRLLPGDVRRISIEWVGDFGWASVRMMSWTYGLWLLLVLLVVVLSVALGRTPRERLLAPAAIVVALLLVAALDLFIFRQTRFPVYGRYTLPLGALIPLVAGHVLTLRAETALAGETVADRLRRLLPLLVLPVVALVQLIALWTSAHRAAVSVNGPVWFFGQSQFVPPGGWEPWFALAVLGAVALAATGLLRAGPPPAAEFDAEPTISESRPTSSAA